MKKEEVKTIKLGNICNKQQNLATLLYFRGKNTDFVEQSKFNSKILASKQ